MAKLDFSGAVERPFQDFRKLSIGALTFLVPLINIVTGMAGAGYALELARKPGKLPEWDDWAELFKHGLLAYIILIIYSIPLYIIWGVLAIVAGTGGFMWLGEMRSPQHFITVLGPIFIVGTILGLAFYYFIPGALVNYAKKNNITAAFEFGDIYSKIFSGDYFRAWIFNLLYGFVIGAAAFFLMAITSLTVILPFLISAYAMIALLLTASDIYGQVWKA